MWTLARNHISRMWDREKLLQIVWFAFLTYFFSLVCSILHALVRSIFSIFNDSKTDDATRKFYLLSTRIGCNKHEIKYEKERQRGREAGREGLEDEGGGGKKNELKKELRHASIVSKCISAGNRTNANGILSGGVVKYIFAYMAQQFFLSNLNFASK